MRVVGARHNRERTECVVIKPMFAIHHQRQFAQGHAMNHRYGQPTYTRLVFHVENRAIYIEAVGIGAVEDNHQLIVFRASLHHAAHGDVIGVKTKSYILNIYNEHIKLPHGFVGWAHALAVVEREDGHSGLFVYRVAHFIARTGRAPKTMFGGENGRHVHAGFNKAVKSMNAASYTRMVAQEGNVFTLNQGKIYVGSFGS